MRRLTLAAGLIAGLALTLIPATANAGPHPNLTGASVKALSAPNIYSDYKAGVVVHGGGWRFRYVAASFQVPPTSVFNGAAADQWETYLQLSTGGHVYDIGIAPTGAGTYQAEYQGGAVAETAMPIGVISTGDVVRVSIYFDQTDQAFDFQATDITNGGGTQNVTDVAKGPGGDIVYAGLYARPAVPVPGGDSCPLGASIATDCLNEQLVSYNTVRVTTYGGNHVNLAGGAPVASVVETDFGRADDDLFASAQDVTGTGVNIFMRP